MSLCAWDDKFGWRASSRWSCHPSPVSCNPALPRPQSSPCLPCLSLQNNWALDQVEGKDLLVIQNYPVPVITPPRRPAPPWSAVPFAAHGRVPRSAPVRPLGFGIRFGLCMALQRSAAYSSGCVTS